LKRRRATVVGVEDASTLIIRPHMAVRLAGVETPPRGSSEAEMARRRLEELSLNRKIEFEVLEWDRLGCGISMVWLEGLSLNEIMRTYIEVLAQKN
jgi:endonuclease YncB( thermonuclease family)